MKFFKIFLILAVVIACILAIISYRQEMNRYAEWEESREVITVYVGSGDTLDGYWAEYAPEWMDRYTYREEIKALNDMKSANLYAGTYIDLYVERGN